MLPQLVHTIGATTYFVIFILMVWINQIPKTDQGPLFWAMAMCFAFLARLVILIPLLSDIAISFSFYCIFITFEKLALLLGAIRCFKVESDTRWWWALALCSIVWLILAEVLSISNWVYAIGLEIYNITTLLFLSYFTYLYRDKVNNAFILAISVTSFLLAIHWSTFVLSYFNATWKTNGFMIGTALMLTQYLALLGAQLSLIQQRLLDAESSALSLAYHDPLTGLSNQRYLFNLFDQVLQVATRPHQKIAIIFIDLDKFKPINDNAGHKTGDEVLKVVAERLQKLTRKTDICARIGGDEFIVLATQLEDENHIHQIADKLRQQIMAPIKAGGNFYELGVSMGISIYPDHGQSLRDLIEKADNMMYQVKNRGTGGYALYSENAANNPQPANNS